MAIGIQAGGGGDFADRTPVLKYNAKAGRFYRVDRSQDAGGEWQTKEVEIRDSDFKAIVDLENIEIGWLLFAAGAAPDIRVTRLNAAPKDNAGNPLLADRPSPKHKQGFRVHMQLAREISATPEGGDVRELAATAGAMIGAIDALHNEYVKGVAANPGKLPVVVVDRIDKTQSKGKNDAGQPIIVENFAPVFAIKSWADRPAALSATPAPAQPVAANEGKQQPVVQAVTTAQAVPASDDQF